MVAEGHQVASLTGEFIGAQRDAIIDAFRNGTAKVLIATNVLSRGIDVQSVSMVVNYVSTRKQVLENVHLPSRTSPTSLAAKPTRRLTSTELAEQADLAEWASPSPSCTTRDPGSSSTTLASISRPASPALRRAIGMWWRRPSRRSSRAQQPRVGINRSGSEQEQVSIQCKRRGGRPAVSIIKSIVGPREPLYWLAWPERRTGS